MLLNTRTNGSGKQNLSRGGIKLNALLAPFHDLRLCLNVNLGQLKIFCRPESSDKRSVKWSTEKVKFISPFDGLNSETIFGVNFISNTGGTFYLNDAHEIHALTMVPWF